MIDIAHQVAEAAKEKSSKGTSQGRVSLAEEEVIAKITAALKVG